MSAPGPAALGRGVIVAAGAESPEPWRQAPRIVVGSGELADPAELVESLRGLWAQRKPMVIELDADPAPLREPASIPAPPYELDPALDLPGERLHHLLWANNYDARAGDPVWWWAQKAARLGARPAAADDADVVLADGQPAWIDGGPRWSVPAGVGRLVHASTLELGRLDPVSESEMPPAGLAPDQLAAVEHAGGPVRVIAPAGSGKTRVLTERVRHLLGARGYDPEALLAVAYNKEAQLELEARLFRLQPRTRTLNSLGYRIVAEYRGGRPRLLDEIEVRRLIEDCFPIPRTRRTNTDPLAAYLDALTLVRLGLRSPGQVEEDRDDVAGFAEGFDGYRAALGAAGGIDFDEQIYTALEALLVDGAFRRRMQVEHRHLLVDEFQDLTPAHVLLIRLLAMPALDVFGVGDDDQTIYDHAGADPRFLVDYRDYFPGAEATALEVNYRCPAPIVAAAGTLLAYNRVRVAKEIRPAPAASADPEALVVRRHPAGAAAAEVAALVAGWRRDGVEPERMAVLVRVNSLLLAPQVALWSAGVPLRSHLGATLLERTGVAAALAWIRVAVDPEGLIPADLEAIRRRPSRGFPNWISKWFVNCRSVADMRAVQSKIDDARVSGRVGELADDIELLAGMAEAGATVRVLLEAVRDRIGLGGAMEMLDGSKAGGGSPSHLDDLEALLQVSDLHPDAETFEPWLRAALVESRGDSGVTLSTVHRVKGREWDRVAVFGVTAGLLPHRLAVEWEGERRVLHVAVTRARERCVVLADEDRPSPFLDELSGVAETAAAPPPAPSREAPPRSSRPAAVDRDSPAFAALRGWRADRARADGVPAYVVFPDRALAAIAAAMPADLQDLLDCDGVGPAKLERYGDEVLVVLAGLREG